MNICVDLIFVKSKQINYFISLKKFGTEPILVYVHYQPMVPNMKNIHATTMDKCARMDRQTDRLMNLVHSYLPGFCYFREGNNKTMR